MVSAQPGITKKTSSGIESERYQALPGPGKTWRQHFEIGDRSTSLVSFGRARLKAASLWESSMSENKNRNISTLRTVPSTTATDIRLLVLDLDGTIVDKSNQIRDSVTQTVDLVKRRGVAVAIATGRRYQ